MPSEKKFEESKKYVNQAAVLFLYNVKKFDLNSYGDDVILTQTKIGLEYFESDKPKSAKV